MSWRRRKAGRGPAGMFGRWEQVHRTGEVALYPFTAAELNSVTLNADALPEAERGPFLQAVTPLLAAPGTADAPGPALARLTAGQAGTLPERATAGAEVTRLEGLGFLRPGPPAPSGRAPGELPGWAAGPAGELDSRRPVTLLGDLAIVTRIRAQPVWVAEVTVSPKPARPDPAADGWPVVARIYAPYRPPVGLVEQPPGAEGLPPYVLVRDDRAVRALAGWCGADVAAALDGREGGALEAGPPVPMPTAEVSGAFAALTQLRVAVAHGPGVLLRSLVVATGTGRHWLLEGDRWQRAVPVSADGLRGHVAASLKLPTGE